MATKTGIQLKKTPGELYQQSPEMKRLNQVLRETEAVSGWLSEYLREEE